MQESLELQTGDIFCKVDSFAVILSAYDGEHHAILSVQFELYLHCKYQVSNWFCEDTQAIA